MSTPGVSSTERVPASWLPAVDGRAFVAVVAVLGLALVLAGRVSTAAFGVVLVAVLLAVAFAARRWPLPTLVAAAVTTLADLQLTQRILPEGFDPGPIGLAEPMLLVAGTVIALDAIRRRTFAAAMRDPVLPLAGLFVALAIVSAVVNAVPPQVALLGIVMTVDAIAIYFTGRMVQLEDRAAAFAIGGVVAVVVGVALFGIAQVLLAPNLLGFFTRAGQFGEGDRISSIIGSPNMLAAVIGIAAPFVLYGTRHLPDRRWRWVARVALLVLMLALLLTFSRGAWLSVAIGCLAGTLLVDWRSLPILVVTIALAWGAATVMPRGLLVAEPEGGGGNGNGGTGGPAIVDSTGDRFGSLLDRNDTRGRYLRDGLRVIEDNLLLGVGPGRYGGGAATIDPENPSPVYEEYDVELFGYRTVHNFWLHLFGESGVLGTAVFLTMIVGLLIRLVRGARDSAGLRFVVLAGAATMLMVVSLHSVTEMIFEGNMPVLIVWLLLGIASLLAPARPLFGRRPRPAAV
jgi:putative inorganic carbon (HCO3(-)) transporter